MAVLVAVMIMVSIGIFSWDSPRNLKKHPLSTNIAMVVIVVVVVTTHYLAFGVLLAEMCFANKVGHYIRINSSLDAAGKHRSDTVSGQVFFSWADKCIAAFDFKEALEKVTIDLTHAHFWDITGPWRHWTWSSSSAKQTPKLKCSHGTRPAPPSSTASVCTTNPLPWTRRWCIKPCRLSECCFTWSSLYHSCAPCPMEAKRNAHQNNRFLHRRIAVCNRRMRRLRLGQRVHRGSPDPAAHYGRGFAGAFLFHCQHWSWQPRTPAARIGRSGRETRSLGARARPTPV